MRALLTGGAGYLGCWASEVLLRCSEIDELVVFDKGLFAPGVKYVKELEEWSNGAYAGAKLRYIEGDLRNSPPALCKGMDAVVHLAGLSNDPTADFSPKLNWELNVDATKALVDLAVDAGVERFIFASSCSVYGFSHKFGLTERDETNPQSAYAESKLAAEKIVRNARSIGPIVLRQGTVSGYSPRMRYDLIVNTMAMTGIRDGVVRVFGPGDAVRPLIDAQDIAESYVRFLLASEDKVCNEIFNVAMRRREGVCGYEGYTTGMVGALVVDALRVCGYDVKLEYNLSGVEKRSYDVSCVKMRDALDWEPSTTIHEMVVGIVDEIKRGCVGFDDPRGKNIEWMKAGVEFENIIKRDGCL